ncbi:MAG: type III-B CRISPR-associated protein Cas10/Cmr2 [Limisphaerales bacterium]
MGGSPDWSAAAADRFVFPHGNKIGEALSETAKTVFVHPLSGRREDGAAALPSDSLHYPSQDEAEAWFSEIRPEWKSSDPQTLFLRAWRHWSDHAADHATGKGRGAELLSHLPADTRIPDGSIWHHCAVVSALEATRASLGGPLDPAFLIFQAGPVQEFIAQARSTRDLWSGSYLVSWLAMHAIKAVADQCGPDAIIFPSLKGQPIYDFLESRLDLRPQDNEVLVSGIPNRFLAIVPASFNAAEVASAFDAEWKLIARECRDWLSRESRKSGDSLLLAPPYIALFDQQVDRHWQITWQLWPWQDAESALTAFKALPLGAKNPIHLAEVVAKGIPDAHKDERCYRGGGLDAGWAWSAHYQLCQHALDARRSIRDFSQIPPPVDAEDKPRKPGNRDALSGREEAVVQAGALDKLKSPALRALFRHTDPLDAANLVKRVWHKAYLARLSEVPGKQHLLALRRARESFDSVPAIAAGAFARRLFEQTRSVGPLRERWLAFAQAASEARGDFPDSIASFNKSNEPDWLESSDHSIFFPKVWQREQNRKRQAAADEFHHSPDARARLSTAEAALRSLLNEADATPSSYYAVLALDGDEIGKWLSGEKSPAVSAVISSKARVYFGQPMVAAMTDDERLKFTQAVNKLLSTDNAPEKPSAWDGQWPPTSPENWIRAWLASPRPLGPSWHLQLSEALANFGLYAARRIVEVVHHGQLIYSGGDDVLAMLPADEAITCATNLRAAFQGRLSDMSDQCRRLFREKAPEGFLWLAHPKPGEPTWPLLVPGPRMTVSVGLAIGHVKEPLQDMIAEAQRAEKRAKASPEQRVFDRSDPDPSKHTERWTSKEGWNRDALAVTLSKRSGEAIRWGTKFGSPALPLLAYVQTHFRAPWNEPRRKTAITGRFPYRLAELLGRYGEQAKTSELLDAARREVEFVISRQTCRSDEAAELGLDFTREALESLCAAYLEHLAGFRWNREGETVVSPSPRPLRDFINLFLLEAFIRRQSD